MTDRPDSAGHCTEPRRGTNLQAEVLDAETTSVQVDGDTATVGYTYDVAAAQGSGVDLRRATEHGPQAGDWVRALDRVGHPSRLGDTQTMSLRSTAAPRARVNERSGTDVLVPGVVHRIKFDRPKRTTWSASATALSFLLAPFDASITAQSIVESATSVDGDYPVALLRRRRLSTHLGALRRIPGVTASDESDLVSTDPTFAPDLVGQVKKAVIDEVDGKAGWSVVTTNRNGIDIDVLTDTPPEPAPSFSISLDRNIQVAAQRAVNATEEQAMTVVIATIDRRHSRGGAEPGRRSGRTCRVSGPVPTWIHVQDHHRRRGHLERTGNPGQHCAVSRAHRDRRAQCAQLQRVRTRRRDDDHRIHPFVQHLVREVGQRDVARRADRRGVPVRRGPGLRRRRTADRLRFGASCAKSWSNAPRTVSVRARWSSRHSAWPWLLRQWLMVRRRYRTSLSVATP